MDTIQEVRTFTFSEVHKELEMENSLLQKEHNIGDFREKSEFLEGVGFRNSKATKMYKAISESEDYRREFNLRYGGAYKFILKEQLERVCEKYNLFVRDLAFFAGDIPEKNIKDMMDFRVSLEDLVYFPDWLIEREMRKMFDTIGKGMEPNLSVYKGLPLKSLDRRDMEKLIPEVRPEAESEIKRKLGVDFEKKIPLNMLQKTLDNITVKIANTYLDGNRSALKAFSLGGSDRNSNWLANIEIAAVQDLFIPTAFQRDSSRLGNQTNELIAKGQVDLDPIVMIKNYRGYIIITAWGDEANDELVVNQSLN